MPPPWQFFFAAFFFQRLFCDASFQAPRIRPHISTQIEGGLFASTFFFFPKAETGHTVQWQPAESTAIGQVAGEVNNLLQLLTRNTLLPHPTDSLSKPFACSIAPA